MTRNTIVIALIIGAIGISFAVMGTSLLAVDEAVTDEDVAISDIAATPDIEIEAESEADTEAVNQNMQDDAWSVDYTPAALAQAQAEHNTTVIFFHANWCPTCKAAARDFEANAAQIPDDVQIVKADYDTASDLKQTYNITTQHTFVALDSQGNEIDRWVGGDYDDLIERVGTN